MILVNSLCTYIYPWHWVKYIFHSVNSTVNTIRLLLTRSNIHPKFFFKAFAYVANLHFNIIFYFPVKQTFVVVYFILAQLILLTTTQQYLSLCSIQTNSPFSSLKISFLAKHAILKSITHLIYWLFRICWYLSMTTSIRFSLSLVVSVSKPAKLILKNCNYIFFFVFTWNLNNILLGFAGQHCIKRHCFHF